MVGVSCATPLVGVVVGVCATAGASALAGQAARAVLQWPQNHGFTGAAAVGKIFARHVIDRHLNPRLLSYTAYCDVARASYDVASNVWQAVRRGGRGSERRHVGVGRAGPRPALG